MGVHHLYSRVLVLALFAAACGQGTSDTTATTAAPGTATYDDPWVYCAAVGTLDQPDDRFVGSAVPDEVISGYLAAAGLEATSEPMELLRETTVWRCMNDEVYACNVGANLPCESKADTGTTPSEEMVTYCTANPDSDFIPAVVTGRETVYSWRCAGDLPEVLEQVFQPDAAGFLSRIWYRIQPEGAPSAWPSGQILFASDRGGRYDDLYLIDVASGDTSRLTSGEANTFPGPFSPEGDRVVFTGSGLTHTYIGVMPAGGGPVVELTDAETDDAFPAWSPDGADVAFTSFRAGNNDIYVMRADGTGVRRLTSDPADDFGPAWSPDGRRIAFVSDRGNPIGVNNLYVMDADGSDVIRLTDGPEIDYGPAWSPDGSRIAFRAHHDGPADIYLVAPDGTGLVNLTNDPAEDWAPSWSSDGRWLAFQTDRDGNWEVYVTALDGSAPVNVTNAPSDDQMPFWRPAVGMANPASVHCAEVGGTLAIETRDDLGQIGVCSFQDDRQCEEWALLRGDCPAGGVEVTGYVTAAGRFCAITGGRYEVTESGGPEDEQGVCTLPDGSTVDALDYYEGR